MGWNVLLIAAGLIAIFYPKLLGESARLTSNQDPSRTAPMVTARLWTLCPLVILVVIHSFGLLIAAAGFNFS